MVCPGCRDGLYSWVGANFSAYWGQTLEEGIKKRLGAFRPDFPVAAGQQVSLLQYAPGCRDGLYSWVGAKYSVHTRGVTWRRESRGGWCFQT
jgi:hypothetical protein